MREIEGWLTLIGSSHTMIHTKQARPGKKTEFFYKLFTSSRTVKHSNLNSALGKRMLLRILKKETSGRDIFCLQAPIIILSHMSRTRLIWSYLSKKVCTSGWLYIEKFKKIVHLYLRLFDRLTWEVSCNAFDKRCVTSERKSPFQQLSIFTRVRRDLSKHVPEWQVGAFCWTSNWSLSKISHHGSSSRATIRHCQHFKSKLSPPFSSQSNTSFEGFVCEAFNERIMATGHSVQLPSGKQIWWSTLLLWTRFQTCMHIVQTQRLCDVWPRDKKTTRKQFTWRATNRLSTIFALKVLKEFKKTAQRPFYQLHCRLESS